MEAKELRDRIIKRYKDLDWSMDMDQSEWTNRTKNEIFGVIGREMGFEIEHTGSTGRLRDALHEPNKGDNRS